MNLALLSRRLGDDIIDVDVVPMRDAIIAFRVDVVKDAIVALNHEAIIKLKYDLRWLIP